MMIELTFLKELVLIKQVHHKSVIFVTAGISGTKSLSFNCMCNRCHDLLMMSMNLSHIAILKFKNVNYCCIITGMSKSEAIKLIESIDLTEKNGTL